MFNTLLTVFFWLVVAVKVTKVIAVSQGVNM